MRTEIDETLEELELNGELVCVELTLIYDVTPGEPRRMPSLRDEVGDPGCPPQAEFDSYQIDMVENEDGLVENDATLDAIIEYLDAMDFDTDEYHEQALEQAGRDEQEAHDEYWQHKLDVSRGK